LFATYNHYQKMKHSLRRILMIGTAIAGFSQGSSAQVYVAHTINQPPVLLADAGVDQSSCNGVGLTIGGSPSASGGQAGYSYNWQPPTGLSSATVANPVATPTGTQAYTLTVTDANGCTHSDQVNVTSSNVTANFTFSTNLLTASFSNSSVGGTTYLWDFGNLLTSTFANPSHTYAAPGTYMVCLIVDLGTPCQDSLCMPVTVGLVGVDPGNTGNLIVYPNPLAEGDIHFALTGITVTEQVEIELYDATGRLVRNYKGPATQEIHKISRQGLANGSYTYKLHSGEAIVSEGKIIFE
jgi:PKD domain/Secretion system C-terminal sorting domain